MTLREWWGRVASSKYTRGLEAEVARLRDENRALLNSILGIAGVPPVMVTAAGAEATAAAASATAPAAIGANAKAPVRGARPLAGKSAGAGAGQSAGPMMRRRSWQQIYRMLEMDSARKKEAGETV